MRAGRHKMTKHLLLVVLAGLVACAPVSETAMYVVDGVRMEVTRDRSVVDTSDVLPPLATQTPGTVVLAPPPVSQGMVVRRADQQKISEADRPRAEAAFSMYCAARGQRAPSLGLIFDRADHPTAFMGICVDHNR